MAECPITAVGGCMPSYVAVVQCFKGLQWLSVREVCCERPFLYNING